MEELLLPDEIPLPELLPLTVVVEVVVLLVVLLVLLLVVLLVVPLVLPPPGVVKVPVFGLVVGAVWSGAAGFGAGAVAAGVWLPEAVPGSAFLVPVDTPEDRG